MPQKQPTRPYRSGERGAFLLAVLVFSIVLGGLSLAFLQEGLAERTSVHHHETSMQALEIAEVGLVQAELEIRSLKDLQGDGIGTVSDAYGGGVFEVRSVQDPDYPDRWRLRSRGEQTHSVRNIELGVRRREGGYFIEGLFSRAELTLNGGVKTDSYNSQTGPWVNQALNVDSGGRYANGRGHIGSNEGITLNGTDIHVRGNAIPGPLFRTDISGQSHVWGDIVPRRRELVLDPTDEQEFLDALASNSNGELEPGGASALKKNDYNPKTLALSVNAQTHVVLNGGTYFFTDVVLGGGATLVIRGPSRIYVTGTFEVGGGSILNESGVPTDCLVFAHPYKLPAGFEAKSPQVKFNGGPKVALGLYAPYRDVTVGGGTDVYGSVIGGSVTVSGDPYFHYDEALRGVSGGTEVYLERLYWREVNLPRR